MKTHLYLYYRSNLCIKESHRMRGHMIGPLIERVDSLTAWLYFFIIIYICICDTITSKLTISLPLWGFFLQFFIT